MAAHQKSSGKEKDGSTIHVSLHTKTGLDARKIHPRESYDQVIRRLLERPEEGEP